MDDGSVPKISTSTRHVSQRKLQLSDVKAAASIRHVSSQNGHSISTI